MGQKPTGPATGFSLAVIEEIERAREESGMGVVELIRAAGIGANTYYAKMRGDRPFNTNEIDILATALGVAPELILRRAAGGVSRDAVVSPFPGVGGARNDVPVMTEEEAIALGAVAKGDVIEVEEPNL